MAAFIYRYKTSLKRDIGLISLVSCNAAVTKDRCCIIAIIIIIKTKNRLSNKQTSGPNGPVGNNLLFPQYYLIFFHLIISLLPSCNIKCNYIKITKALAFLWPPPPKKIILRLRGLRYWILALCTWTRSWKWHGILSTITLTHTVSQCMLCHQQVFHRATPATATWETTAVLNMSNLWSHSSQLDWKDQRGGLFLSSSVLRGAACLVCLAAIIAWEMEMKLLAICAGWCFAARIC